jgi:bifunctional DNA-binding transcriptional regulator/antitoxin component of YhaV-PrlF toxin-antitoxin module
MNAKIAKIDPAGRLSISAQQRRALGLERGGAVVVTLVGEELRIKSITSAMKQLQAKAARMLQGEHASVDAFLAERRAEAARENAEFNDLPSPHIETKRRRERERKGGR